MSEIWIVIAGNTLACGHRHCRVHTPSRREQKDLLMPVMKSVKARNTGQLQNVVIGVVVNWLGQILNFIFGSTEIQLDVVTQPVLGDRNFLPHQSEPHPGSGKRCQMCSR